MLARNLRLTVEIKELHEKNTSTNEIASILKILRSPFPRYFLLPKDTHLKKYLLLKTIQS
jgi:DNA polymerase III delta subunit